MLLVVSISKNELFFPQPIFFSVRLILKEYQTKFSQRAITTHVTLNEHLGSAVMCSKASNLRLEVHFFFLILESYEISINTHLFSDFFSDPSLYILNSIYSFHHVEYYSIIRSYVPFFM